MNSAMISASAATSQKEGRAKKAAGKKAEMKLERHAASCQHTVPLNVNEDPVDILGELGGRVVVAGH